MGDRIEPHKPAAFAGLIGAGREDITPPVGIFARSWGAARHDVAEGVHRPLTITALSLQTKPGEQPVLLAAADLGWWRTAGDEWFVRSGVIEALGLEPCRVMLALSHTHSGPSICREDSDKPGGHLIAPYLDSVREALIRAARRALKARQPAVLTWGTSRCALAANRDLPDPERPRVLCGYNPDGPADDAVRVGRVTAMNGAPLATIVHYACHPTMLAWENRLISPDYVGAMRVVVEAHTNGAPCLYLHGAAGELAARDQYTADTTVVDSRGRQLGYSVLSALEGMLPPQTALEYAGVTESGAPLAVWKRVPFAPSNELRSARIEVELPLQSLPSRDELAAEIASCQDRVLRERLVRKRRVRETVGDGDTTRVPIWLWRVGEAVIVGHPNEAYSGLQTELQRRFPDRLVLAVNIVNGHCGYLPPEPLYDLDIYPVWQTPFGRGSLELVEEACMQALNLL